jgi:hypothetical protein
MSITGTDVTFFVNIGEKYKYLDAGANRVVECGNNISQARNVAIRHATKSGLPSVQVSDDLKSIKQISLVDGKRVYTPISFGLVCETLINQLKTNGFFYGGVAVSSNPLNYTGEDFSYDKLVVCDLICIMPAGVLFDEEVALKEDYDLTIRSLLEVGGLVRCNHFLCDFPHRENKGGANDYRNALTEKKATDALRAKWGMLVKDHPTRPGQISLNYQAIQQRNMGQQTIHDWL